MLITPRTYQQSQEESRSGEQCGSLRHISTFGWSDAPKLARHIRKMLLVHQTGSVRIGEVVRYTLTYTPSRDRILPSPSHLFVKIKNSSAIPLRAAYLHGPYTLYAACYPSTFDPNYKDDPPYEDGAPEFEPNLKAGGSWMSRLMVPERIRGTVDEPSAKKDAAGPAASFTWIIEISSQVIFSTSAAVHFELLVSRDEKSLELGYASLTGQSAATPGQLEDHQQSKRSKDGRHNAAQSKGVYSRAVKLVVDDTVSLWNKPALPNWSDEGKYRGEKPGHNGLVKDEAIAGKVDVGQPEAAGDSKEDTKTRKRKRVHLVVLTHGLHSNLGADMLYLKESIDAAAKKAREDKRTRRSQTRSEAASMDGGANRTSDQKQSSTAPLSGGQDELGSGADIEADGGEEEVIVRGFPGNACRTERGIQYLGKRLAKWILSMTYPDQPFLPAKKSVRKTISRALSGDGKSNSKTGVAQHHHSSIYRPAGKAEDLAYKITSISFIGHSLGGLTQTYAIAYIHTHSPRFFDDIKPINFVAMAVPFLGLSNENPLYVKFALDFGLVGKTGKDLGLTWKSSTALRGGWEAMIAGIGADGQRAHKQPDPGSKPLLRILPTGHAHQVLKLFRNRSVYSNVVNDGIVPLRTSCLLFLDWSGLGRVEKARRENGLVAGLAGWGWAELTGANSSANKHLRPEPDSDAWSQSNASGDENASQSQTRSRRPSLQARVPQPEENAVKDDNTAEIQENPEPNQFLDRQGGQSKDDDHDTATASDTSPQQPTSPMSGLLSLFRPSQPKVHHNSPKHTKIYKKSQTTKMDSEDTKSPSSDGPSSLGHPPPRPANVRGDSVLEDPHNIFAPPKTTIFEAAGDVLNPPLPSHDFLINPKCRPRTIFHDRVYHPQDIPPPPLKKPPKLTRSPSSESRLTSRSSSVLHDTQPSEQPDFSGMKVEEKIARAYHHGLSWRKVLVRLEPDAHNNMVVRRMFSNAYGWPVIKHLVDTHFADTYAATTADRNEPSTERAKPIDQAVGEDGGEVRDNANQVVKRTDSETREAKDRVPELKPASGDSVSSILGRSATSMEDSAIWDDLLLEGTDDEEDISSPVAARHSFVPDQSRHHEDLRSAEGNFDPKINRILTRSPPVLETESATPASSIVASPKSTTSLGLGKSLEEQLKTVKKMDVTTINDSDAAVDTATSSTEHKH